LGQALSHHLCRDLAWQVGQLPEMVDGWGWDGGDGSKVTVQMILGCLEDENLQILFIFKKHILTFTARIEP
jgi:hypothetical protein